MAPAGLYFHHSTSLEHDPREHLAEHPDTPERIVAVEAAIYVLCTGLEHDHVETPADYTARLEALRLQMLARLDETGNRFRHHAYRGRGGGPWKLSAGRF